MVWHCFCDIEIYQYGPLVDIEYANKFRNIVNWILFDYKDDLLAGGTGKSFNWNLLSNKSLNLEFTILEAFNKEIKM